MRNFTSMMYNEEGYEQRSGSRRRFDTFLDSGLQFSSLISNWPCAENMYGMFGPEIRFLLLSKIPITGGPENFRRGLGVLMRAIAP